MLKADICLIAVIVLGVLNIREAAAAEKTKFDETKIILYQDGTQKILNDKSTYFQGLVQESERLLKTTDSSYRLVVTEELIVKIKKESAIEVIYPKVETVIIPFNQQPLHLTKLLIPLSGKFANGTIFFSGIYAYALGEAKPEYSLKWLLS